MFFRTLTRQITLYKSFRIHPEIGPILQTDEALSSYFPKIKSIIDEQSKERNFRFIKEGLEYVFAAYSSSQFQTDPSLLLSFFQDYGNYFNSNNRADLSAYCYKSALSVSKAANDYKLTTELIISLINQLITLKNYKECEKILNNSEKILINNIDQYSKSLFFSTFGKVKILSKSPNEALVYLEKSRQILSELEPELKVLNLKLLTLTHLCTIFNSTSDNRAQDCFDECLEVFDLIQKEKIMDNQEILEFIGFFAFNSNFIQNDEKFYQVFRFFEGRIEDYSKNIGLIFYDKVLRNSEDIGITYKFNERVYESFLEFVKKNFADDNGNLDRAYFMIACKMLELEKFGKVEEFVSNCVEIRKMYFGADEQVVALNLLVSALVSQNKFFQAKKHMKDLKKLVEKIDDLNLRAQYLENCKRLKNY